MANEFKFRKKLGQLLLERGLVTEDQLRWAMDKKEKSKKYLGEVLVEAGYVKEEDIVSILAEQADIPFVDLKKTKLRVNPNVVSIVPHDVIRRFEMLPYKIENDIVHVLISRSSLTGYRSKIRKFLKLEVEMELTVKKDLNRVIESIFKKIKYRFDINNILCIRFKKLQLLGITIDTDVIDKRILFENFLIKYANVKENDLEVAKDLANKEGKDLKEVLKEKGFISNEELLKIEALMYKTIFVSLKGLKPKNDVLKLFDISTMKDMIFLPIALDGDDLIIALSNLEKRDFFKQYKGIIPYNFDILFSDKKEILDILDNIENIKLETKTKEDIKKNIHIERLKEKKLGIVLVKMGYISKEVFEKAWKDSKKDEELFSTYLINNNMVDRDVIYKVKQTLPSVEYVDLKIEKPDYSLFKKLPPDALMDCLAVPLKLEGNELFIAVASDDPETIKKLDVLRLATSYKLHYYISDEEEIIRILLDVFPDFNKKLSKNLEENESEKISDISPDENLKKIEKKVEISRDSLDKDFSKTKQKTEILKELSDVNVQLSNKVIIPAQDNIEYIDEMKVMIKDIKEEQIKDLDEVIKERKKNRFVPLTKEEKTLLDNTCNEKMIVNFLDNILALAVKKDASDIHFEPFEKLFRIRFRINGILHILIDAPAAIANPLISRLKVMSELDLSEKRVAQDGSFNININNNKVEFRIVVSPSAFGETSVLRILNVKSSVYSLDSLGLSNMDLYIIKKNLQRTYGLILVAGPTGSGKTTSLYAMLNYLNASGAKIVTIEDPVEAHFPGIIQMEIKINKSEPDKSFTFSDGLKASMRSDPNIIMLGEIRDAEIANVAIQASLTGHLVLATIHANNSIEVISRLLNLGVERELLASSLKMVIAQRLARVLCKNCKKEVENKERYLKMLNLSDEYLKYTYYEAPGCEKCNNNGFIGRTGIYEILEISEVIKDMMAMEKEITYIKNQALRDGLVTLKRTAFSKAVDGIIGMQEFVRIGVDSI